MSILLDGCLNCKPVRFLQPWHLQTSALLPSDLAPGSVGAALALRGQELCSGGTRWIQGVMGAKGSSGAGVACCTTAGGGEDLDLEQQMIRGYHES